MSLNELMPMPMPDADGVTTATTWKFTVDVSGNIKGTCNVQTGDCIMVTNAEGTSFIGNIYAVTSGSGDQTVSLVGVESMQVDKPYSIIQSIPLDAPGVNYYIRVDKMEPLVVRDDPANGTIRVGGG